MKKVELILRSLSLKGKKFVVDEDIKNLCRKFGFDVKKIKRLLLNKGYLVTIFRGIFYLKDYNEKKTGKLKYNPDELLAKGLELKKIDWYFGLDTALKILNLTHEIFPVAHVINDKFHRIKPIKIAGKKYKFIELKKELFLGIKKLKTEKKIILNSSDLEKTILDMVYLAKRKGLSARRVLAPFFEYEEEINKNKLLKYSRKYPKTIQKLLKDEIKRG